MGTKNCKHCGALMDSKESACPVCGKPQRRKRTVLLLIAFVWWVFYIVLSANNESINPQDQASTLKPLISTSNNINIESKDPDLSDESGQVTFYVKAEVLNVRDKPSTSGKVVGQIYLGDTVLLYEKEGEWGRVNKSSNRYGNYRWVSIRFLTNSVVIPTKQHLRRRLIRAISHSDDYAKYKTVFIRLSQELIDLGHCKLEHFEERAGWIRSQNYKPDIVYFTYCGPSHVDYRVYLDPESQTYFRRYW